MKRRKFIRNSTGLLAGSYLLSSMSDPVQVSNRIIPKSLRLGDYIAITGPAGCIWNKWHITKIEEKLNGLGYKTKLGKTLYEQDGYLAGNDKMRADEFMSFFEDKSIKAILTMRGGWGCSRILDLLDYDVIKNNPKIIMGFSDITSLINAIYTKTGLVTYHGPCGYSSWKEFTTNNVLKALVSGQPFKMENPNDYKEHLNTLTGGVSRGELIGGNLTVVVSMLGTDYEPDWNNKILLLEETTEEPYRIDRMLWQLKQNGVFNKIKGLALGSFHKCEPEEPEKSFSLQEVLEQHFRNCKFPVYQGATFGHLQPKFTLPLGIKAELNADEHFIKTLEDSVIV